MIFFFFAIFGLKSSTLYFPLFINQVVIPHRSLISFVFRVFIIVLLRCVVCVNFFRFVMTDISVLGYSKHI